MKIATREPEVLQSSLVIGDQMATALTSEILERFVPQSEQMISRTDISIGVRGGPQIMENGREALGPRIHTCHKENA